MTGPDELRLDIARAHGLPDDATLFLTATTLDTLEHQAAALAKIIGTSNVEEQPAPATNPFTQGPAGKAARQRNLLAALHAPPPQERDERGRFTSGFDGGARQPVPTPRDPEADHNALLAHLAGVARTFGL